MTKLYRNQRTNDDKNKMLLWAHPIQNEYRVIQMR